MKQLVGWAYEEDGERRRGKRAGKALTLPALWAFPVDDGLVLVRPDISGLFLLNQTAQLIWREFAQGRPLSEIVSLLAGSFGIPAEMARRDIEAVVDSWHQSLLAGVPSPHLSPATGADRTELTSVDCMVNGRSLRVYLERGEVWDELAPRLAQLKADSAIPQATFEVATISGSVRVFRDGHLIGSEETPAGARAILLQAMVSDPEPAAILHAGGCGGVLLAGRSYSGKSTLCAALMAAGVPYHCDDSAVLDQEFRVLPMPFPLVLRQGSWQLMEGRLPEFCQAPRAFRMGTEVRFLTPPQTSGPAAVTALVFVQYREGAETRLTELGTLEALLELQHTGFWVRHTEEVIGRFLAWLASIRRFSLSYSSLPEAETLMAVMMSPPEMM